MAALSMLKSNIVEVKQRIAKAAEKKGVNAGDITLVAVTKTIPLDVIKSAWELGISDFGENKVQEGIPKIQSLPSSISWHFIGHLQTNKAKFVVPDFKLVQSLDRTKLAQELQKEGEKQGKIVNALLQVNAAREKTKSGFYLEEVEEVLHFLSSFSHVKIQGLMTIAPYEPDPEKVRPYFRELFQLFSGINVPGVEMRHLSMGMTNDFEIAIEEGSNMVRVGTAIFGERE